VTRPRGSREKASLILYVWASTAQPRGQDLHRRRKVVLRRGQGQSSTTDRGGQVVWNSESDLSDERISDRREEKTYGRRSGGKFKGDNSRFGCGGVKKTEEPRRGVSTASNDLAAALREIKTEREANTGRPT